MDMLTELLHEVARLDRTGEPLMALQRVAKAGLGFADLIRLLDALYRERLDATAYLISGKLIEQGAEHWTLDLIQAHVATVADLGAVAMAARQRLRERMAGLDPASAGDCRRSLMIRLGIDHLTTRIGGGDDLILRVLELSKLAQPIVAELFPGPVTPGLVAASPAATVPTETSRQAPMEFPVSGTLKRRAAVVALRHRWYLGDPGSRLFDLGPRMVAAMARYGWDAKPWGIRNFYNPEIVAADCAGIAALCEQSGADVLIIDEPRLDLAPAGIMADFIADLRRRLPGLSIVAIYLDPWDRQRWNSLQQIAPMLDFVWSPFPSIALWSRPEFSGKMVFCPIPCGEPRHLSSPAEGIRASFVGGIDSASWVRNYWLAALSKAGADVRYVVTNHKDDGLPALESYGLYLDSLSASGCCLNFSMRTSGVRTLTGRAFEAPWSGALLVQEDNGDIDHYFTPWRHYIKFSTFPELVEIIALIRDHPEVAEEIRHGGHAFATSTYSDERIIGHLDWRIGGGGSVAPVRAV